MSTHYLEISPRDPLISRDGRPFGAGQGNRMRGLPWLLPSVVAGSFRTALVKAGTGDFSGNVPDQLKQISVAGVFPVNEETIYLPAPADCVWDEDRGHVFRVQPVPLEKGEGVDLPMEGLKPVRLTDEQAAEDFKPKTVPAWWPLAKYEDWLTGTEVQRENGWFDASFLQSAERDMRDHVCLDAARGAAAESLLFATANLSVHALPKHGEKNADNQHVPYTKLYQPVSLTARVQVPNGDFAHAKDLDIWHPLGGERRLVHWKTNGNSALWACPEKIKNALKSASHVRMVLATSAIFRDGWKPGWLDDQSEGSPPGANVRLKLIGVCNDRWRAVSGWSLETHGPKPIRRMVPAGAVYFFEVTDDDPSELANRWLQPVSDDEQERRDGFGLAIWGTW
ncbi:MAG: CRISPR-associated protein Cmr3 [Gemmatales bacterium]|nr:MAG: CRISPR-associated protein Cmr3 [Gemmatales bacterium]